MERARSRASPKAKRRAAILRVLWALALPFVAAPASPSCQSPVCQQRVRAWERDREAALEAALAADPGDAAEWEELLSLLSSKLRRDVAFFRYEAAMRWEPQPFLEGDGEGAVRKEREAWLAAWRESGAPAGDAWCYEARIEPDPKARVGILRRAAGELPDHPRVRGCLVDALVEAGEPETAVAEAESFRDRLPTERAAWDLLVTALQRAGSHDSAMAAAEERERRFPSAEMRRQLIAEYTRHGRVAERERLLARIETEDGLVDRFLACGALWAGRERGPVAACQRDLLVDLEAAGELGEEELRARESARDSVLMSAIHDRDWSAIRPLLAAWPPEGAARAWATVASWLDDEGGCAALLDALRGGRLEAALREGEGPAGAVLLSRAARDCGDPTLAEELARPRVAVAEPTEILWLRGDAAREELARRISDEPSDARLLAAQADLERELPGPLRAPTLEAWAAAAPDDTAPALHLSRLHEADGQGAEAVRWREEAAARAPEDLDLRLSVGTLALRVRDHRAVVAAARHVLAVPASPRHHAEAHYLLGRVALREGRREEAASELLAYFPPRLRYAGCPREPRCDRGLLLLLLANADPRLQHYLGERAAAMEWYGEHMLDPPQTHPHPVMARNLAAHARLLDGRPDPVDRELTAGCRMPGTLEYLAARGSAAASVGERARRLRLVSRMPPCPAGWPTDLDALFPDAMLLRLGPELTEVR